jgi:hypothetical protein
MAEGFQSLWWLLDYGSLNSGNVPESLGKIKTWNHWIIWIKELPFIIPENHF